MKRIDERDTMFARMGYKHGTMQYEDYYSRNKDKKEIDLLIVKDGKIYPLEFKKTASPKKSDVSNFSILEKLNKPIGEGGIVCLTEHSIPLTKSYYTIPVSLI